MARKRYRKWRVNDIRKIKHLRDEGYTWTQIANIFGESKINITQIYKYYRPMLDEATEKRAEAVAAVTNSDANKVLRLREIDIEEIVDTIVEILEKKS